MQILQKIGLRSAESDRSPLWMWPLIGMTSAVVAALLLSQYRPTGELSNWLWYGDVDSVSSTLQTIATAIMTATTIVFSLTLVALQMASQQFSPRLLREFNRDPVIKAVLTTLVTCFAFSLTLLRQMRSDAPVPALAVLVAYLLGLASVVAILGFIAHITRIIRIDTIMRKVHDDAINAMEQFYPQYDAVGLHSPDELDLRAEDSVVITSVTSGFVRMVDSRKLIKSAEEHGAVVRIEARPGDHVGRLSPIASLWKDDDSEIVLGEPFFIAMEKAVRGAVVIDYERTFDQDAAFGFRQLEDIAVKAMSPSINDPATAQTATSHMADMLVTLCDKRLGPTLHLDEAGRGRAIIPDRDYRYYVDTASAQLRRFAASEPSVLSGLMAMFRDAALACRDDEQRGEIRRGVGLVLDSIDPSMLEHDKEGVRSMARRVELALQGHAIEAYADEAGATRST